MRFTSLFLTTLLGVATALPLEAEQASILTDVSARDNFIEAIVREILEDLRNLMINGSEGIPVMDPFELSHMHLELGELIGLEGSHVTVSDAVMTHLSSFEIDNLRITLTSVWLQQYTMELDGHIPSLNIEADTYDIDVTLLGLNIFGNGRVKLRIIEPRITGTVVLGIRLLPLPIGVTIHSADVGFTLGGFETEFTGLFDGDQFLNDFVSLFLGNLVPELVKFYEDEIRTLLSTLIMDIANGILSSAEIGSMIGERNVERLMSELPAPEEVAYPAQFVQ